MHEQYFYAIFTYAIFFIFLCRCFINLFTNEAVLNIIAQASGITKLFFMRWKTRNPMSSSIHEHENNRFWLFRDEGRSRISMVWVPPLGFDPYCDGKWLPLQDEFTPSINSKNSILCYKGVQYYFTHARRSPECVKKYARVAYVILCNSV